MDKLDLSRRKFVGGVAAALGYAGLAPEADLFAQTRSTGQVPRGPMAVDDYDAMAKLASNENPYGPPDSVLAAINKAMKYANRYGYPDGGIVQAIAGYDGVKPENILLGAGSTELLCACDAAFLQGGKKVVGVEPTFLTVFAYATGTRSGSIMLPLKKDYSQDIPLMIRTVKQNYRDIGLVYLCNPNNPTGVIVAKHDVKALLDGIPEDIPVLIDEAYHHFVEDQNYATSIPYVLEGRNVIVARTFSKIVGLAGMRLGYVVAPKPVIAQLRTYSGGNTVSAVVKWGGAAALKDTASHEKVRRLNSELRTKTTNELQALGFDVIPSQTNYFMVNVRRNVVAVAEEFKKRGVLVGRPFPPMMEHLRVSVGTADEMARFMTAFKEIFAPARTTASGA